MLFSRLEPPEETEAHSYVVSHKLAQPMEDTVTKHTASGPHWGLLYFTRDDPYKLRDLLKKQEELDFYV